MASGKSGTEVVVISLNSTLQLHAIKNQSIVIERASFSRVRSRDKPNSAKFYQFWITRQLSYVACSTYLVLRVSSGWQVNFKTRRSRRLFLQRSCIFRLFTLHRHSRRSVHARTTTVHMHCVLSTCVHARDYVVVAITHELGESHPSRPPTSQSLHTTHTRDRVNSLQHNMNVKIYLFSFFFKFHALEKLARLEKTQAGR